MTLAARAILWLDAARPGGFRAPLPSPVGSLLYVPMSRRFREHAGFDALGVVIRPNGAELEPDAQDVSATLTFLHEQARPWVSVGSEFSLLVPPLEVGHGRVIELLEEGA